MNPDKDANKLLYLTWPSGWSPSTIHQATREDGVWRLNCGPMPSGGQFITRVVGGDVSQLTVTCQECIGK